MKNGYIFKKLVLAIVALSVFMSQNTIVARAANDDSGWPSYPDGSLPFEWCEMPSWNLDLDLTKCNSGDELAKKSLSSKYQPTSLTVTYAVPKTNSELWKLLNRYNMRLLLVTCLEDNPNEEWYDKGPDVVCYCYALDDPIAKHVRIHFYDDIGRLYGLSEELIKPESSDYTNWDPYDDSANYYAFNFACSCYQDYEDGEWFRLDQYWGHSYLCTRCKDGSIYASPHSLRIDDEEVLEKMEEYIVEFRKVRGLPEL